MISILILLSFYFLGVQANNDDPTFDVESSRPMITILNSRPLVDGVVDLKFSVTGIENEFSEICNFYVLEIIGGHEHVLVDDLCSHCIAGIPSDGFACAVAISGDPALSFECKIAVRPTGGAIYRDLWMHRPLSRPGVAVGALHVLPVCFRAGCAPLGKDDGLPAARIAFPPDGAVLGGRSSVGPRLRAGRRRTPTPRGTGPTGSAGTAR